MSKAVRGFVLLALAALVAGVLVATRAGAAPPARATLPGSAPSWANAHNRVGSVDPNGDVGFRVSSAGTMRPARPRWREPSRIRAVRPMAST
jgi:hypothetical protein